MGRREPSRKKGEPSPQGEGEPFFLEGSLLYIGTLLGRVKSVGWAVGSLREKKASPSPQGEGEPFFL